MKKPLRIAIASGKGGTGKTTVSVNLFKFLNQEFDANIQLVDCDVEEPNDKIFFNSLKINKEEEVYQLIPFIDTNKCSFCKKCTEYCEFNAIVVVPSAKFAEVNSSLCHSCGACSYICQDNAITENKHPIGNINEYQINDKMVLTEGRLTIGSAMQTLLIKDLKKTISNDSDIILFDAPPGTSCPVVETVADADYVILVAEPTLFGLHDFKLMHALLKELNIPFGLVVNKASLGDKEIYKYIEKEKIDLLGEIAFSKEYATLYSKGHILDNTPKDIEENYLSIIDELKKRVSQNEGDYNIKW